MAIGCVGFLACWDRLDCWRLGWELWEMTIPQLATIWFLLSIIAGETYALIMVHYKEGGE